MGRTNRCKYEDWEGSPVCTPGAKVFMRFMASVLCALAVVLLAAALYRGITWPLVPAGMAALVGLFCSLLA